MAAFASSGNNTEPQLCANDCGFYGNVKTRNLCSSCYNAFLRSKILEDFQRLELEDHSASDSVEIHSNQEQDLAMKSSSPAESKKCAVSESIGGAKTKTRCVICKKKIGTAAFNCKCGGPFCREHRFPDKHSCVVDHKKIDLEKLAKEMVLCKGDSLKFRI